MQSGDVTDVGDAAQELDELKALAGNAPLAVGPSEVPLKRIEVKRSLFQPRAESERHVYELKRAIQNYGKVDPLTVMMVGGRVILLDGHHRLTAYQELKYRKPVPVEYFTGTVDDALLVPGEANAKAKLPMMPHERGDFGWRLVCLDKHSKAQIAAASGLSTSQVGLMRKVKADLKDEATEYTSWMKALGASKGKKSNPTDEEINEWKDQQAQRYANELTSIFQTRYHNQPEIVAKAFVIFFGRKLPRMVEELVGHLAEEEVEAILQTHSNPDF